MSLENNNSLQSKLHPFEQHEFANGAKLLSDCYNIWEYIKLWFIEKAECEFYDEEFTLEPLTPLPYYIEIYTKRDPEIQAEILEKSDPEAVQEFNRLVDEFNSLFPAIEMQQALDLVDRAAKLTRRNV